MSTKALIILLLLLLALRFYYHYTRPFPYKDGEKVRITSSVDQEPLKYDDNQYIKLQGLKIYLPVYPQIYYGDRVIVEGTVNLEKRRLDKSKLISTFPSSNLLYLLRRNLLSFYDSSLPSPHSGLIAGMVLGSKSGTVGEFYKQLKATGTVHVVVASGMNVSLVGGFLLPFFALLLKRKNVLIVTLCGIWSYVIIAGFDAPVIRAGIMGSIAFLTQEVGRIGTAIKALVITGLAMLVINPGWITDIGFLLSFFATLTLILFEKKMRNLMLKVPSLQGNDVVRKTVVDSLSTSFAAQIGVAPILIFAFGGVNIFSPFINALILWTVPPITILGMTGGILGLVVPVIGKGVLLLSYPMTWWFVEIIKLTN